MAFHSRRRFSKSLSAFSQDRCSTGHLSSGSLMSRTASCLANERGTSTRVIGDWSRALDNKHAICFDFSKAFNLVDYQLLMSNLPSLLSPMATRWIALYQIDRKQLVKTPTKTSSWSRTRSLTRKRPRQNAISLASRMESRDPSHPSRQQTLHVRVNNGFNYTLYLLKTLRQLSFNQRVLVRF